MDLMEAWKALQDAAPYIVAVLAATTALAHVLQRAAHALDRWAAASAPAWDDEPARNLARAADWFVRVLDWLTMLLPRIGFGALTTSASAAAKKRAERQRRGPPGGAGAASMLLGIAIAVTVTLTSACGGAYEVETTIGEIAHSSTNGARATIMGERRRALLRAGERARAAGESIEAAVNARANEWDETYGDLVHGFNLLATAVNRYVRETLRAAKGEPVTADQLRGYAADVAHAWNDVVPIIERHHLTDILPLIPEWAIHFLETGELSEGAQVTS